METEEAGLHDAGCGWTEMRELLLQVSFYSSRSSNGMPDECCS